VIYSDRLIQATDAYANGWTSWEQFHAVLETDFYRNSCGGACTPCSRKHAAKQAAMMKRRRVEINEDRRKIELVGLKSFLLGN
jgi:hypothetical protein